jgi:hypothetical protein
MSKLIHQHFTSISPAFRQYFANMKIGSSPLPTMANQKKLDSNDHRLPSKGTKNSDL